jgi:Na+-transporting NADH:ubiquinone oxidoreductase subunit C
MKKETTAGTLLVTLILTIVCSVLVSFSAVYLKPLQEKNRKLDIKKNLLITAQLIENSKAGEERIANAYEKVEAKIVDLASGLYNGAMDPAGYDQAQAVYNPKLSKQIDSSLDVAGIKIREKFSKIYFVKKQEKIDQVIFPIYGKGLWSTLYGFISLGADLNTIKGISFYSHGETPGLGGEIENPSWKKLWINKKIYGDDFKILFDIVKGKALIGTDNFDSKIDGLSGATLTGNGVEHTIHYWFGKDGYLKFIKNEIQKQGRG